MDSLIVMRKPLRKSQLTPKFTIPKKPKKAAPRSEQVRSELARGPQADGEAAPGEAGSRPAVSFVRLYRSLCAPRSPRTRRRRASPRLHFNSPETQRSDSSIVTQYKAFSGGDVSMYPHVYAEVPPASTARTELMFELDYGTSFNDSRIS